MSTGSRRSSRRTARRRAAICVALVVAPFARPLPALDADPTADLQRIQSRAEAIRAQADACAKMRCPVVDCDALARKMQALVDAEATVDALYRALIDAEADARKRYFDAAANSHLTGVKISQLQDSLAWEEFFHKLGSNLLKVESILNTLNKIDKGELGLDESSGLNDVANLFDSLANALKNVADLTNDAVNAGVDAANAAQGAQSWAGFKASLASSPAASSSEVKDWINSKWDVKSDSVDVAKVEKELSKAVDAAAKVNQGGGAHALDALTNSRNLRTLIARQLKEYSEQKLKAEKALLKELEANQQAEAAALIEAYRAWRALSAQKDAAQAALAAARAARDALAACMAKAGCGSKTLKRPELGPYKSYGEAISALVAKLAGVATGLDGGIAVRNRCPEEPKSPAPPEKPKTPPPAPPPVPPKHVIENDCPPCASIALELARTLDEREFVVGEMTRIRADLERAAALEQDAELLRKAIDRISELIRRWGDPKEDRNALLKLGDAIFKEILEPHAQIDLEMLEREKRDRQNSLHVLEEKIRALRAEEGRMKGLEADNGRLFDLAAKLRDDLARCQKSCPRPKTECGALKAEFEHWDKKQKDHPSSGNRKRRDAELKKLCDCLKRHPEEQTEELRKLCPPGTLGLAPHRPGRRADTRVGFVYSSDSRPNDAIVGTIVDDPENYRDSPLVTLVEWSVPLLLDDDGVPILAGTTIAFDGGPAQPADAPVACHVPPGPTSDVTFGAPETPEPLGEAEVRWHEPELPSEAPPAPETPPACVHGNFLPIEGLPEVDPAAVAVEVAGRPARVVAATPREVDCLPAEGTPSGAATVTVAVGERRWTAEIALLDFHLSADRTDLQRGQSTTLRARLRGLHAIPESAWGTPYSPERVGQLLLARSAPGFRQPDPGRGHLLLVLENRARDVIEIDGEMDGRIVVDVDRARIQGGVFEFTAKVRGKRRGAFNIHGTVVALMNPVRFRPE